MVVRVQAEDFDVGAELAALGRDRPAIGAMTSFVGMVRDSGGDDPLVALVLEHYPGMTERQLEAIEAEARRRWPLDQVLVIHRHGRLCPGDRIVLVATTSAHRDAAFDSCRFLIDWLKTQAPFWKQEVTTTGSRWVEAKSSDDDAAARWSL
ncbi:MAG: molybdenum cofactor biosynthesis protein MoaE [Azospirillaceae bacterium]|nr:molybdenum cofactor biosynthesis protein MoaE [Azospirillaceae bacterium]